MEYLSNWAGLKAAALNFWEWFKNIARVAINAVSDEFAKIEIGATVKADVTAEYGNRQLNDKDAEKLIAPDLQTDANALRDYAKQKGIPDDILQNTLQGNADAANEKARQQYSGRQLSDGELDDLIAKETQRRLNDRRKPHDAAADLRRVLQVGWSRYIGRQGAPRPL